MGIQARPPCRPPALRAADRRCPPCHRCPPVAMGRCPPCSSRGPPALLVLPLLLLLLGPPAPATGQDFDLSDALEDVEKITKKPSVPTRKPSSDDVNPKPQPQPPPNPGNSGSISDDDLIDANPNPHPRPGGHDQPDSNHNEQSDDNSPGVIPGIVSAVVVAVVGAISSFIAYQKKKFCFKGNEDPETVRAEGYEDANKEPPVQSTLLQ
ncbi:CD99 antigen isoform X2 [Tachyglossus aculeatus]|uniref:CD99 antigen isoform X2 n=1 Tax=Tachyglossus aculeatus TaxID=9261 RepID=UPI0018F754FA|nr:CD99 antigen isoform X2 [Tachyglossus aculeatus]